MTKFVLVFLLGFVLQLGNCDVECFEGEQTIKNCSDCICEKGIWACKDKHTKDCPKGLKCTPGQLIRKKCEECRCPLEGNAACRKADCKLSDKDFRNIEDYKCLAGDFEEHDGCNTCRCFSGGSYRCTISGCNGKIIPAKKCIAGDIKMEGCTELRCDTGNKWVANSRNCNSNDKPYIFPHKFVINSNTEKFHHSVEVIIITHSPVGI